MSFVSLIYGNRYDEPSLLLTDTQFTAELFTGDFLDSVHVTRRVLLEYNQRNKCVAQNLALLYLYQRRYNYIIQNIWSHIEAQCNMMYIYYPSLHFKLKYYPCIRRQIEQRSWANKLPDQKDI